MKTIQEYLGDANKMVPRLPVEDAISWHKMGKGLFIEIRVGLTIQTTGTIPGALHIPRGFLEFAADDSTDLHYAELHRDASIVLMCMAGGMSALAGKTLIEMGYRNVVNGGGFHAWQQAGGPVAPFSGTDQQE